MDPKEIEQRFASAGWQIDNGFEGYLVLGDSGNISILAHRGAWGTNDSLFELLDHQRNITYWVEEVPTPQQAQELLEQRGDVPEKWEQSL